MAAPSISAKSWVGLLTDGYSDPARAGEGSVDTFEFPLPDGHAAYDGDTPLPMVVVFPRPDSETNAYERQRLHPSGTQLRIPVGVRGGNPPYRYSVSSNMPGLTIGQDLPRDWWDNGLGNYGVLICDGPAVGTYTTTVTITDQDADEVSTTFTTAVVDRNDTSKFRWFDTVGGDNSDSGSFDSPYKDNLALAFGASTSASTFTGHVCFKDVGGEYTLTPHSDISPGIRLDAATRPVVVYTAPTPGAVTVNRAKLRYDDARFATLSGNAHGLYFSDIDHAGSISSIADMTSFGILDSFNRITFGFGDVTEIGLGTAADDNATFAFFASGATSDESTYNRYVMFRRMREIGRPSSGNSYGLTSAYGLRDYLFEDCHTIDSEATVDMLAKDSCREGVHRYCTADNTGSSDSAMWAGSQQQNGGLAQNQLFEFCRVKRTGISLDSMRGPVEGQTVARCTLMGRIAFLTDSPAKTVAVRNTIIRDSRTPLVQANNHNVTNTGTELQGSTDYFDSNLKLRDAYAAYRGTRGAEIFD